jgi:hypothetical protein
MSENLNEAVAMLNDLVELARSTTSAVEQARLDAVVDELAPAALEDVERFAAQAALDKQTAADAKLAGEEQAALNVVAEEERAAAAAVQDETDEAQRRERMDLGVS